MCLIKNNLDDVRNTCLSVLEEFWVFRHFYIVKMYTKVLVVLSLAGYLQLAESQLIQAVVLLQGPSPYVTGNITLSQSDNGPVAIWGKIQGLTPGQHGFHIHEKGDITGGCGSTGGHYNPYGKNHGGPKDLDRHVGDLGNIQAGSDGVSLVSIADNQVKLTGPYSVIGRAIVVHSGVDDLGKGGAPDSLTTGNAGSRIACGIIGKLSPSDKWPTESDSGSSPLAALSISALLTLLVHIIY